MTWDGRSRQSGTLLIIQYAIGLIGSGPSANQMFSIGSSRFVVETLNFPTEVDFKSIFAISNSAARVVGISVLLGSLPLEPGASEI